MKVVYFGSDVFLSCFEYFVEKHQVLALYTYHNDEDYFTEYAIVKRAGELGIPVHYEAISPEEIRRYFTEEGCELFFIAEYDRILTLPEELPALICAFILNADDDPAMSEKQVKEFDLPGGGVMNCPVSEGIVLLDTAPGASFGRYLEVQRLIAQSFGSIRNDVSQRQFGADYASLAEPERQVVARAVPLKLTEPRLYK